MQTDGLRGSDECTADAVPAGKRLVIEHVTARVHLPVGQTAYAGLKTSFLHFATFLPLVPQETRAGYTDYVSAVSARLRIPAGGRACVWLDRNEGDGSATGQFWISGYLVDAP